MPKKIQLDIPLLSKLFFKHKGIDVVSCHSLSNLQIAMLKHTFYVVLKTSINLDLFPNEYTHNGFLITFAKKCICKKYLVKTFLRAATVRNIKIKMSLIFVISDSDDTKMCM